MLWDARPGVRYDARMTPWEIIDNTATRDGDDLILARTDERWEVLSGYRMLMTSELHASEEALAQLALERHGSAKRVLVGGLGLGFTLRATLDLLPHDGEVVLAETSDALVRWNRTHLAELARRPLEDARVKLVMGDVCDRIAESHQAFDAILLDVDNGPVALVHTTNDRLYGVEGVQACFRALRPRGVLAIWSSHPDDAFLEHLRGLGLKGEAITVPDGGEEGGEHVILLASAGS